LGDDIVLTIVRVGTDKVRIGVEAPSDIRVLRLELSESKARSTMDEEVNRSSPLGHEGGPIIKPVKQQPRRRAA
jgi:carbon storage regulator CsrA